MIAWSELRKERHVLELEGCEDGATVQENGGPERPLYYYRTYIKWDGCLEITQCFNGFDASHTCSEEVCGDGRQCCRQDFHICNIDQMIAALQDIKTRATEHFSSAFGGWPG